jgi:hypothetical protein
LPGTLQDVRAWLIAVSADRQAVFRTTQKVEKKGEGITLERNVKWMKIDWLQKIW